MDSSSALLLDARREYQEQLIDILYPFISSYFQKVWASCKNSRGAFVVFQKQLKNVRDWSESTVSEQARVVEGKYPFFSDLVTALLVANIKVLSDDPIVIFIALNRDGIII